MTDPSDNAPSNAIPFDDDVPWKAWTPDQVAARLKGITTVNGRPVRWATAGGWALDLFLGRITRDHEDLEIVVLNDDVALVLDAFGSPEWRWNVPADGWLHPLGSPAYSETHQTWLWSQADSAFVLDVFRDEHDDDTWICRRDPKITMPWSAVADTSATGTPYLIPEVVLLFKAKHARPKDLTDMRTVLPSLNATQRVWLRANLEQVHPGHDWLPLI
jgi:Aminoglycoside-2''-adenylyltransferase